LDVPQLGHVSRRGGTHDEPLDGRHTNKIEFSKYNTMFEPRAAYTVQRNAQGLGQAQLKPLSRVLVKLAPQGEPYFQTMSEAILSAISRFTLRFRML
jgi:hypothetical protein